MAKAKAAEAEAAAQDESEGLDFEGGDAPGGGKNRYNLADVNPDASYPVMAQGIYSAIVDVVEYGMSQRSGKAMFSWQFLVVGGDHNGRRLYFHTVLEGEEPTLARSKKAFMVLAPKLLEGEFDAEQVANSGQFVGRRCRLRVGIQSYQGRPSNSVKEVLKADDGAGADSFV